MTDRTDHPTPIELQTDTSWYTLEPLRADGQDALLLIPGIRKITLREIELPWQNPPDDITIHKADNLFERAAAVADQHGPIRAKAILTRATFDLELENSERPLRLTIRPPDTIIIESRADADAIRRWLEKCRFRFPRLCRAVALALLTLAGALLTSYDDDTDDDDSGRHGARLSVEAVKR